MPTTGDSRASATLQDDKFVFEWQEGDAISVFNASDDGLASNNNKFVLKEGDAGVSGDFVGYVEGDAPIMSAIYPYNENHSYDPETGKWTVYLPSEYGSYEEDYNGNTNAPMLAMAETKADGSVDMSFKHLGAVLRLELKNVPAEAAKLRVLCNIRSVSGTFEVQSDSMAGCSYIETTDRIYDNRREFVDIKFRPAEDMAEITNNTTSKSTRDMSFFVPLPTGEYPCGLAIELYNKEGHSLSHLIGGYKDMTPFTLSRADVAMYPVITLICTSEGLLTVDQATWEFNEKINQNDSIKLDQDLNVGLINISKDVTIDCNGYTLVTQGICVDSGTLTIKNTCETSPFDKTSIESSARCLFYIGSNGTLRLEDVGAKSEGGLIDNRGCMEVNNCCLVCREHSIINNGNAKIIDSSILLENQSYVGKLVPILNKQSMEFTYSGRRPKDDKNIYYIIDGITTYFSTSSMVFYDEPGQTYHNNVICKKIEFDSKKPESIKIDGGTFYDPEIVQFIKDKGSNVVISLQKDYVIKSPICLADKGSVYYWLNGHTITNSTDSDVNPVTGEKDGNIYTSVFVVIGETDLHLYDETGEGGVKVNVESGTDGIRRAIWMDGGWLLIRGGKYFSSQSNKNSKCEVIYLGEKYGQDFTSDSYIEDGIFETDCYTRVNDACEDICYWTFHDDSQANHHNIFYGGEFVNFNPLKPGYTESIVIERDKDKYVVEVYDEDGNDIELEL
ncbi:MAG: fimbrillin family protein, partial [Lachnospiraceae bacterium]|nr:fimbrillin family protein [Lachnospiraceae bacterium]